jgi:hypothetical protein
MVVIFNSCQVPYIVSISATDRRELADLLTCCAQNLETN